MFALCYGFLSHDVCTIPDYIKVYDYLNTSNNACPPVQMDWLDARKMLS